MILIHANLAKPLWRAVVSLSISSALSWVSAPSYAADPPSDGSYAFVAPVPVEPSGWQFRFTPYAWAPSVDGDVTVRGHNSRHRFFFWDIFDSGSSGAELESLAALMGYMEVRKGAWGIYGDVVWGSFDFSGSAVTARNPIGKLNVSARANAGLDYETTMVESGVAYEVAKWGDRRSSTAFDVLGGARYWNQELDLSLAVDGSVDVAASGFRGRVHAPLRDRARSNGWTHLSDCVCVTSWRREASFNSSATSAVLAPAATSPGSFLAVTGSTSGSRTSTGLVGYRALAVDYTQDGPSKNNLDLILHGPVIGLSFRW